MNMSDLMPLLKRKEAAALGLRRYFTGEPCIRGHFSDRETAGGRCMECAREAWVTDKAREYGRLKAKRLYARDPDKFIARRKAWAKANPEKDTATHKNWRDKNKERIEKCRKVYNLRNKDRLTEWRKVNYAANRDAKLEYSKRWRQNHPDIVKQRNKKYNDRYKLAVDIVRKLGVNLNEEAILARSGTISSQSTGMESS